MDNHTKAQVQTYLRQIYAKRWVIIAFMLLTITAVSFFLYFEKNVYQSYSTLIVETEPASGLEFLAKSKATKSLQNHIFHINSYKLSEHVLEKISVLKNEYPFQFDVFSDKNNEILRTKESKVLWIKNRVTASLYDKNANIIKIKFESYKPEESTAFANIFQEVYIKENLDLVDQELIVLKEYLQEQKFEKETLLYESERIKNDYMKNEGINQFEQQSSTKIDQISEMQQKLESYKIDLEGAIEERRLIDKQLKDNNKNITADQLSLNSDYFKIVTKEISDLEARKLNILTQLKNQGINVKTYQGTLNSIDADINNKKKKLDAQLQLKSSETASSDPFALNDELRSKYLYLGISVQRLQKSIDLTEKYLKDNHFQTITLPDKKLHLTRLDRQIKIYEELYIMITKSLEETKISLSSRRNSVKEMDSAKIDLKAIYPIKMKFLLISFFSSIVLSIGFIYLIEYLDNTIKTEEELESFDVHKLGLIPSIDTKTIEQNLQKEHNFQFKEIALSRLVSYTMPQSVVAESYRSLRTSISFQKRKNKESKTFLMTSCGPQEGKSTTILNTATAFAQSGLKILVVDCDMRRPTVHSVFSIKKDNGLTDVLLDDVPFEHVIKSTFINNLYVITSGVLPPNPSELISMPQMENFIDDVRSHFDLILFDTPPVVAVTDSLILSEKVDHTILIVRANKTDRDMLSESLKKFKVHSNNLIGAVLNDFNFEQNYGYKYKYYNYYGND